MDMKRPFLATSSLLSPTIRRISRPSSTTTTNAPSAIRSVSSSPLTSSPDRYIAPHDHLYEYTRGRFLIDEASQIARRRVRFNMDGLASVAAASVGARHCVNIEKCPDGLYNKAYILTMDNGKEVIAKIPNPNAGIPYYTTASEVATMDFARDVLQTPAPRVYAWNACADDESNPVRAEYIVMEKMGGVPLSRVWWGLQPNKKLKVLLQVFEYQRGWTRTRFRRFGGLYYAKDADSGQQGPLYVEDGKPVWDSRFVVGPAVGREWSDAGRGNVECDRGPWASILSYREAVGLREIAAIKQLNDAPKQMQIVYGPEPLLYQPTSQKKLAALSSYFQILEILLRDDAVPTDGHLWHDDLHHDNIFIDPESLTISGIIDWQSVQIAPLFDHSLDPCILDYTGPDVGDQLSRPAIPESIKSLPQGEEKAAALAEFLDKAVMIAWRSLVQSKNAEQYRMLSFQQSAAGNLLHLSRRIYELGEAHFRTLLLDLQDEWGENNPQSGQFHPFPIINFSQLEIVEIETDMRRADLGIQLMKDIQRDLGKLWPEKGLVGDEDYDRVKTLLGRRKGELIARYCTRQGWDTAVFEQHWPFDG
ncbi:hypothetical protein FQN51_007023 [Onygenales sp. PD_10]|nr:hypothetical protein FQN51_007023 [Onygenales sp. PD_10]